MALTEADIRAVVADELARRRLAAEQLATAPITIGELTDVPAPGSPIASQWSQEVSRRIVHRFASTAERDTKYPAAAAGAGAVCAVGGRQYFSDGTVWLRNGEWAAIVGAWQGFFPGSATFDQWFTRVGDLIAVQFVVAITSAGNAINAAVGFNGGNLPGIAGNVVGIESFSCSYRSGGGSRFAGMITAWGVGMGFSPLAAAQTGSGVGAVIGAVNVAAGVPMAWQSGASMTIAGTYRVL